MMSLWLEWFRCIHLLRDACSRRRTFLWMALVLAAMAIRSDLLGVTSFVRASFLSPSCYDLLLHFFHSNALNLSRLLQLWVKLVLRLFNPVTEEGYLLFVADGLKVPKEGKKMPAVKSLHQESGNNSKPEFIMGHSFQVVSLLVRSALGQVFAVPLVSRICEGLIFRRSKKRKSLLDKLVFIFLEVMQHAKLPAILVADAYYASKTVIVPLLAAGYHLITRARINVVAYLPAPKPTKKRKGRPKVYGPKVRLRNLFKAGRSFIEENSPVYGETNTVIQYRVVDLLWHPVGHMVRFVLVKHPTRGKLILMSTLLTLDPLTIIKIYGWRFKIEVSFKQAIHTLGTYLYHFWMKPMKPIKRGSGNQNITGKPEEYKQAVKRKIDAYHRYVQLGCIAQGLLQHLAINFSQTVWAKFKSWLRTMNKDLVPSELVVSYALKSTFLDFLLDTTSEPELTKFILERAQPDRIPGVKMVA
jgi:hypothetical protein